MPIEHLIETYNIGRNKQISSNFFWKYYYQYQYNYESRNKSEDLDKLCEIYDKHFKTATFLHHNNYDKPISKYISDVIVKNELEIFKSAITNTDLLEIIFEKEVNDSNIEIQYPISEIYEELFPGCLDVEYTEDYSINEYVYLNKNNELWEIIFDVTNTEHEHNITINIKKLPSYHQIFE